MALLYRECKTRNQIIDTLISWLVALNAFRTHKCHVNNYYHIRFSLGKALRSIFSIANVVQLIGDIIQVCKY